MRENMNEKVVTRVVIETKYGENCWRGMILAELDLTIDERERLIANLAWIKDEY